MTDVATDVVCGMIASQSTRMDTRKFLRFLSAVADYCTQLRFAILEGVPRDAV